MAKSYVNPGPISFTGTIQRNDQVANSSAWIRFPHDLKETFGVGNLVPVRATFDGQVTYHGSLSKMRGPGAMILMRGDVRAQLGKGPGDSVEVLVELDDQPRRIEIPQDLAQALRSRGVAELFGALAPSHRREFVRWVEEAKRPETRERRIAKTCEMVSAGRRRD